MILVQSYDTLHARAGKFKEFCSYHKFEMNHQVVSFNMQVLFWYHVL